MIDAQCSAIEDVLQLIRDQSVTMRDPQEVSAQLDNLVQDVEQTEQSVREMEAIFALAAPGARRAAPAAEPAEPAAAEPRPELTMNATPTAASSKPCPPGRASFRRSTTRAPSRCSCCTATCTTWCLEAAATATEYVPLQKFLNEALFGRRDLVLSYDRGGGLGFADPRLQADFRAPSPATTPFTAPSTRRDCRAIPTAF